MSFYDDVIGRPWQPVQFEFDFCTSLMEDYLCTKFHVDSPTQSRYLGHGCNKPPPLGSTPDPKSLGII